MEDLITSTETTHEVAAVIDVTSTSDLMKRYNLQSRTGLSNRINALKIPLRKEGKQFYVPVSAVVLLDALDECLKKPKARLEECAETIKQQMSNGIVPTSESSQFIPLEPMEPVEAANISILQLPKEIVDLLRNFGQQQLSSLERRRILKESAESGFVFSTSELLPLVGLKSIPQLDDHKRFSRMGFVFWKVGRAGRESEWKITKAH